MKFRLVYFIMTLLLTPVVFLAQSGQEYYNLESLLITLQTHQADILFPETFAEFQSEIDRFRDPSPPLDSQVYESELQKLEEELTSWVSIVEKTQSSLANILYARQKAVRVGAEDYAPEVFIEAESRLRKAAKFYSREETSWALENAREAETLYRMAEFESIENNLLGEIRILMQESADLQAEKFAPESYLHTRELLKEVEELIDKNRIDDPLLSQKSRELMTAVKQLLSLVQTINPIYQSPSNLESFLLSIQEQVILLSQEFNFSPQFKLGFEKILADLQTSVQNLKQEKLHIEERNQQLELEKQELEKELLKYKSLSEQEEYLQKKINRLKIIVEGPVEKQGRFLTFTINPLVFKDRQHSSASIPPEQLSKLLEALHEFSGYPILIRYIEPANGGNISYNQDLANRRAEAIKDYLKSRVLFRDNHIQAAGVVYDPGGAAAKTTSCLEIRIDLGGYLSFGQPSSGTEEELPAKNYAD